jgi:hypothetical protein
MDKIRKTTLIFAVLFLFCGFLNAQQLVFDGVYSGKKMILNNPISIDFFGTCINRITINGELYPFNISDNYLEVDMSLIGLRENDFFTMTIDHGASCQLIIYNKEDFMSKEPAKFVHLKLEEGKLSWQVQNNTLLSPILLEILYKNKWVKIAEIDSKGLGNQTYEYTLPFVISGKNLFRISKTNIKNSFDYFPMEDLKEQNCHLLSTSVDKNIRFIAYLKPVATLYRLNDLNGVTVKEGFGEQIDVTNLKSGFYTLYYDTKKETIIKK